MRASFEEEPFLPHSNKELIENADLGTGAEGRSQRRWSLCHFAILQIILIVLYTATGVYLVRLNTLCPPTIGSPLSDLVFTLSQRRFVNLTDNNPYTGPPSTEVDDAWDALLGPMNLRVTAEELAVDGQDSVALPEGGGYLAWLGAVHELHCIKMLREWKFRDHYHPNLTETEFTHWDSHADHCLDLLRQSTICHADASLTTFVWNDTKRPPMFDARRSTHTCMDWDALLASTADRVVSLDEMKRLENPVFKGDN